MWWRKHHSRWEHQPALTPSQQAHCTVPPAVPTTKQKHWQWLLCGLMEGPLSCQELSRRNTGHTALQRGSRSNAFAGLELGLQAQQCAGDAWVGTDLQGMATGPVASDCPDLSPGEWQGRRGPPKPSWTWAPVPPAPHWMAGWDTTEPFWAPQATEAAEVAVQSGVDMAFATPWGWVSRPPDLPGLRAPGVEVGPFSSEGCHPPASASYRPG